MKRQSYKVKHDFLFDCDDSIGIIPKNDLNDSGACELKISNVLITKDEKTFLKLLDFTKPSVVLVDDIGECNNPASERYKQFIIRCVCRKLLNYNINVYL